MSEPKVETRAYGWFTYLFFMGVRPWLKPMGKRLAGVADTPPLPQDHLVEPQLRRFEAELAQGRGILRILFDLLAVPVVGRAVFYVFLTAIPVAISPLMKRLIEALSDQASLSQVLPYAAAAALLPLFRSVLFQNMFAYFETAIFRRTAGMVGAAVAAKVLRLAPEEREKLNNGTIVSLADRDAWRLSLFCVFPDLVVDPVAALVATAWLVHLLGWAFLPACLLLLLYVPLRSRILAKMSALIDELWSVNRERVSAVSEVLNSIEAIKLFALEKIFLQRVNEVQGRQARLNVRRADLQVVARVLDFLLPSCLALVAIPVHALLVPAVSVATLFAVIAAFDSLAEIVGRLPDLLDGVVDARQAARRLGEFFARPEVAPRSESSGVEPGTVRLQGVEPLGRPGQFSLDVARGSLVCVVGSVGCGKSTLLGLVAGQVRSVKGALEVCGKVSWCPSRPWIINGTLRENMACEGALDDGRLQEVLSAVALDADMALWEKGLETEIGERGINLSGGQRARLALARAALLEGDVVVLDDPYSALDPRVAEHVHARLVKGTLSGKTRIVSTHRLEFAADADLVVVLDKGAVVEMGTPGELLRRTDSRFSFLLRHGEERRQAGPSIETQGVAPKDAGEEGAEDSHQSAKLSTDEDVIVPRPEWGATWLFCKMMAPGALLGLYFSLVIGRRSTTIASEGWLAYWGSHPALAVLMGVGVYTVLQLSYMVMEQAQFSINLRGGTRASSSLHGKMMASVLASPKRFFDTTPTGRIVNRFANDYSEMENALPMRLGGLVRVGITALLSLVTVSVASPWVLLLFPVVIVATIWTFRQVRAPATRLWQLRALNRSLTVSRLTECFEGAPVLQGAGLQGRFLESYMKRVQNQLRLAHAAYLVSAWQTTQNFLFGALFAAAAVVLVIQGGMAGLHVGLAAVALNAVLQMTEKLGGLANSYRFIEQLQSSLKRVLEYTELPGELSQGMEPPKNWPCAGDVHIRNLEVRYRPELAPVLRGASLRVRPGEKVGIVGRTGAGKSTLFLALTRMVDVAPGQIFLDGVDIATLRVESLRRGMTIIPQEPVLFRGSLRFNLDPEGIFGDSEIAEALARAHLAPKLATLPRGLDTLLGEGEVTLSSGERQLLCFARAILRRSKLILLDEATSGIDTLTDALLQDTIRNAFSEATILTIAHRAETLEGCTRVVEVAEGGFVERAGRSFSSEMAQALSLPVEALSFRKESVP